MFDAFQSSKTSNVSKREACWRYVSLCKSWLWWQQGQGKRHLGSMRNRCASAVVVGQPVNECFISGSHFNMRSFPQVFGQPFVLWQVFLDAPKPFMVDVEGGKKARRSPKLKLIAPACVIRRVAKCLESNDCHDCLEVDGSWVTLFTLGKLDMFCWTFGLLLLFAKLDPHPCQISCLLGVMKRGWNMMKPMYNKEIETVPYEVYRHERLEEWS